MQSNWKEEFYQMLNSSNPEDLKIEEAQNLKIANLPSKIYKYRGPTEYAINNLENDTVWLSKPSKYNDPFEFAEYLDIERLNKAINKNHKDFIVEAFKSYYELPQEIEDEAKKSDFPLRVMTDRYLKEIEGWPSHEVDKVQNLLKESMENSVQNKQNEKVSDIKDKMKVCSFCESPENLLMWSHYADFHRGFCIEYNIDALDSNDIRKRSLYPVFYRDILYDSTDHLINLIENDDFNNIYSLVTGMSKSKDWEYEKEWRFIFPVGESFEEQNYPMGCQKGVFLGSRMDKDFRSQILNICSRKGLEAFDAKPSNTRYQLEFEKIDLD